VRERVVIVKKLDSSKPASRPPLYELYPYSLLGAALIYVLAGLALYFIPWKPEIAVLDLHTTSVDAILEQVVLILCVFFPFLSIFICIEAHTKRSSGNSNKSVEAFKPIVPNVRWIARFAGINGKKIFSMQDAMSARGPLCVVFLLFFVISVLDVCVNQQWPPSILVAFTIIFVFIGLYFWLPIPLRLPGKRVVGRSLVNPAKYKKEGTKN
jgi:hypothetical protein